MRWYRALAYKRVQVGTDEMRNPIYELKEEGTILVRAALYAPVHDATEGNQFDVESRTFLTRARCDLLDGVVAIKVHGVLYSVEGMTRDATPTALRVKRCKDGN